MPGALSNRRSAAMRRRRLARYLAYAVGEVVLIFIGITLAVAFEDASKEREQEALVRGLLRSVAQNLEANVAHLEMNIAFDDSISGLVEDVVAHLDAGSAWDDSLSGILELSLHWSSPFLATSGYESLKQSGLHQVPNDSLRSDMIGLFEGTYAFLVGDVDRSMWSYMEAVMYPIVFDELVRVGDLEKPAGEYAPRDFEATVERGRLRAMLLEHRTHLHFGTIARERALEETRALAARIEVFLSESADPAA